MKFVQKTTLLLFAALAAVFACAPTMLFGQDPILGDPDSYVDPANTNLWTQGIMALVTVFTGYFSASIPGLKGISNKVIRIFVTSIVIVAGAAAFKFGFLTKETFSFALAGFLPNFAYSGAAYEVLKVLLKLIGIEIKTPQPPTVKA